MGFLLFPERGCMREDVQPLGKICAIVECAALAHEFQQGAGLSWRTGLLATYRWLTRFCQKI